MRDPRLLLLLVFLPLLACVSGPLDVLSPEDESPRLAAEKDGVRVTGGGSASGHRWSRRLIVSLTLDNGRVKSLALERKNVVLELGLRRVSAHTLVGSTETGPIEKIEVPAGGKVNIIAQFSASFGIRKRGNIALRFEEEGSVETLKLKIPIKMQRTAEPESGLDTRR